MRLSIVLAILALLASPALAGKKAGVTMPDEIVVVGKTLTLNGMGVREATWAKIDVYVAGLYLEHVSSDADAIIQSNEVKRLVLHFKRKVYIGDIRKAWHDGFKKNATVSLSKIKKQMDALDAMMVVFHKGDTLTFTYVPGDGVTVAIKGVDQGLLTGKDFAESLFSIWLGDPPNSGLKSGLLGNH